MTKEILLIIAAIVFSSAFIFACAWIGGPCDGCDDNLDIGGVDGDTQGFGHRTFDGDEVTPATQLADLSAAVVASQADRNRGTAERREVQPVQFRPDVQSISSKSKALAFKR